VCHAARAPEVPQQAAIERERAPRSSRPPRPDAIEKRKRKEQRRAQSQAAVSDPKAPSAVVIEGDDDQSCQGCRSKGGFGGPSFQADDEGSIPFTRSTFKIKDLCG
jgi:hypothetical protein